MSRELVKKSFDPICRDVAYKKIVVSLSLQHASNGGVIDATIYRYDYRIIQIATRWLWRNRSQSCVSKGGIKKSQPTHSIAPFLSSQSACLQSCHEFFLRIYLFLRWLLNYSIIYFIFYLKMAP